MLEPSQNSSQRHIHMIYLLFTEVPGDVALLEAVEVEQPLGEPLRRRPVDLLLRLVVHVIVGPLSADELEVISEVLDRARRRRADPRGQRERRRCHRRQRSPW